MSMATPPTVHPDFCTGIKYFGALPPDFAGQAPLISAVATKLPDPRHPQAAYQTMLYAEALRYLILQMTASKASGHPGGFASQAEVFGALVMLGYKNILTEVGHHAPGFYSALFLDRSLEQMGISTVEQLCQRFRETHGLLGHLSGYIPGVLAPAGPLGQGQHFALSAARLHPQTLFPFTLGDGGLGEPYILSALNHFHTAFPETTNFLPVLVWNGYSQEHHSMVSCQTNQGMTDLWHSQGFEEVFLIDAKDYDDQHQPGPYVDSTAFTWGQRLVFTQAVLEATDHAARAALEGHLSVLIIKQLKGAGMHARGSKSHNLYPQHSLDNPDVVAALQTRALAPEVWQLVRTNAERAGGGPASQTVVTESILPLPPLGNLPLQEFPSGELQVSTTAIGKLVGHVGAQDHQYLVTNADGNEASGVANINQALKIIHPTPDPLYHQDPHGQVYEPLSEDACAGLAAGLALMGARSLWCSYESFAINGLPVWQTVTQAMAELRRPTPATVTLFTAGALEQGRNGWTHQRPEIEAYFAAMIRNGNVFPLFPPDANCAQVCYEWALTAHNKGVVITASKTPLPVRTSLAQARQALEQGALVLQETPGPRGMVVLAALGDMILRSVFQAASGLADQGWGTRIVCVVSPRRLYRPQDVAWETCAYGDGEFMGDQEFRDLFTGDALVGVSGGAGAPLEPLLLRSRGPRDLVTWQRGETTATVAGLLGYNHLGAADLCKLALQLVG